MRIQKKMEPDKCLNSMVLEVAVHVSYISQYINVSAYVACDDGLVVHRCWCVVVQVIFPFICCVSL